MRQPNEMDGNTNNCLNIDTPIKIATYNVRGINNKKKKHVLFRQFKKDCIDITALQETYIKNETEFNEIVNQWTGVVHYTPGTVRSKGLITLFNPKFEVKDNDIRLIYRSDRLIISSITLDNETLFIVNVYCPCKDQEKIEFLGCLYSDIKRFVADEFLSNIICLGDFNIALQDSDIVAGQPHREAVRQSLNDFIQTLNLTDCWRILHPTEKVFTWSKQNPSSARRLDYIFVGENLASSLIESHIKTIGFSDHRIVISKFEFVPFKNGKGIYKINTSLLKDPQYCRLITLEIHETLDEYNDLDPHLRWEMVKHNVRESSQHYSRIKARERSDENNKLKEKLQTLETQLAKDANDEDIWRQVYEIKKKLELTELDKARGAALRAGIKYIEEGEKCTKYFLSLEKSRSQANTIKKLKNHNGVETRTGSEIVEEIGLHFEKIYNQNSNSFEFVSNSIDNFCENLVLPSLDEFEMQFCDASISEAEVVTALRSMSNGSSPGLDGISAEWYKMFWPHVRESMLECFDHSFDIGFLSESERVGVISLVHKGKDLSKDSLSNWRPISLTNVDYKILAKVMSLRLNTVIDKLIGEQQKGFIKGRQISQIHRKLKIYLKS